MYNSELCADPSVADHVLADLPGVKRDVADGAEFLDAPLFIADTVGCGFYEECDAGLLGIGDSKRNPGEGTVVVEIVEKLLGCGVSAGQIGVITPYQGQVGLLRGVLAQYSCLEVGTVDGFQGREKEAIVFSMVRSNDKKEVGFLKEDRRTNVAITRAKRFVCVVCDSEVTFILSFHSLSCAHPTHTHSFAYLLSLALTLFLSQKNIIIVCLFVCLFVYVCMCVCV